MSKWTKLIKAFHLASQPDLDTCGFFGSAGLFCAMFFSCLGSAYGTAKSSVGISKLVVLAPHKTL